MQCLTDDEAKAMGPSLLNVISVADDGGGACLAITYNPMVLPKGVEPSADPMIAARATPHAIGLGRRLAEGPKQQ